jgi:hypothetical protein
MKKLLACFLALAASVCLGQTFPVNNLTVSGTSSFTGLSTFTLSPVGPTPTTGDSSTKLATTAFVSTAVMNSLLGLAPITSPTFLGTPAAPTAALGTNTTQLATTAFVVQHQQCADILDYGGNNADSATNNAAWTAALAAQSSSAQKCVYFPRGYYLFSTAALPYNTDNTSITVKGDGQNVSILQWPTEAAGGFNFSSAAGAMTVHIKDLSLLTAGTNTGSAIFATTGGTGGPTPQEQSTIEDVTIRGADGFNQTDYWQYGVALAQWSQWNIKGLYVSGGSNFSGTGIFLNSTNPPNAIVYNIEQSTFNFIGTGIQIGNNIQGVAVHQCNFDTNTGISVPGGEPGLDQLVVTASQFGINAGTGISVNSFFPNVQLLGNLFIVPASSNGVIITNGGLFSLIGNSFNEGTGSGSRNGISISSSNGDFGLISGNIFDGMVSGSAIVLGSGSSNVNIQSNAYQGNGTNISNSCSSGCTIGGGSQ